MFTQPAPSPPTHTTTTSPASPASPRPSRLRGLSYLRNYTHNHLHSRENSGDSSSARRHTLTRSTSYPSPTSTGSEDRAATPTSPAVRSPTPGFTSDTGDNTTSAPGIAGSTSGWLPTVGGQSGTSRSGSQPEPTSTVSTSALITGTDDSNNAARSIAMGRTRSATTTRAAGADVSYLNGGRDPQLLYGSVPAAPSNHVIGADSSHNQLPSIRFSQYQDARAPRPSLTFSPMSRTLPTGKETIRVGRYSERENTPTTAPNVPSSASVGFKSKVVSRRHCEFWFQEGKWFIKDVKSSSGTFLNHVRLSQPGHESKPFPVKDGDIVQLGIDFKGGEEMIFRCVKIRIELNRGWQSSLNSFNVASHKRLRNMAKQNSSSLTNNSSTQDCTICLGPIAPCQSLFVAPCSHTWHYKCVRRIINGPSFPQFMCPNCRAVADLEAEVDDPFPEQDWEDDDFLESQNEHEEVAPQVGSQIPTGLTSAVQEPSSGRSEVTTNETTNESSEALIAAPTSDPDTGLERTLDTLSVSENATPTISPPPEPQSSARPIDIRPGRTVSGGNIAMNDDSIMRNDRTPSPNGRLPPDVLAAINSSDGPMTPRNDVGPFVFDGSGGRQVDGQAAPLGAAVIPQTEPTF